MVPVYLLFYIAAFVYLERRTVRPHIIHTKLDDCIPFCKYFIVPYLLWFLFVAGTVLFFAFFVQDRRAYYQLIGTLGMGMTVFIIVCFVYPNGHDLRHVLTGNDIFTQAVRMIRMLDAPINILPSIHVFNSVACCAAVTRNKKCREHALVIRLTRLMTCMIIASTLFLKQHSVVDVVSALALNALCDLVFYKLLPAQYGQPGRLLPKKKRIIFVQNDL